MHSHVVLDTSALRSVLAGEFREHDKRDMRLDDTYSLAMEYTAPTTNKSSVYQVSLVTCFGDVVASAKTYGVAPDNEVNHTLVALAVDLFIESMSAMQESFGTEVIN